MNKVLLVRYGEVALKGTNKPYFERVLAQRIKRAAEKAPAIEGIEISRSDGLIVIRNIAEGQILPLIKKISKVFGVASLSPAIEINKHEYGDISAASVAYMRELLEEHAGSPDHAPVTFKVKAKRSDKTYPIESPVLSKDIGSDILDVFGETLKVDVRNPEILLTVHVRRSEVFIYDDKFMGLGGLPLGTNGRGLILLSGGIDSPVAAWMMAKRGMQITAVHFHSYPYTSKRAQEKVLDLARTISAYCGSFDLHTVNLLPAQEQIVSFCPEEETTIHVRRMMMKIAEGIARRERCSMLITGESLGQVASQTAESIVVTDASVTMPVMRPLIALDKIDIMDLAAEIGTYELSIQPYEDCCTVFLPKHPSTKPRLDKILESESKIPNLEALITGLVDSSESFRIKNT